MALVGFSSLNGRCLAETNGRGRFGRLYSDHDPLDLVDDPFTGYDTLRGPYAAPGLAGKKFLGLNIVPRPTDDGNGASVSPSVMYQFIYDYLTEGPTGPTWLQWIKPQIDAAQAVGCNCVRWYWDVSTMVGDASHMVPAKTWNVGLPQQFTIPAVTYLGPVTWDQFATGIQNVCQYLASKGMYYYPTATECQPVDYVTEAGLLTYIDHFIAEIIKYPNVIAVDVIMEVDRCTYMQTPANVCTVMNRARAARGSSTLPLTCSISSLALNNSIFQSNLPNVLSGGVDFIDNHVYVRGSWSPVMGYLFQHASGLPIAMGEGGLTYSGELFSNPQVAAHETTHPKSSELRAQYYQDVIAGFGRRPDLQLYTPYGVTDQHLTDDTQKWGVYFITQDGNYAFTTQKPEMTGPLGTIEHTVEFTSHPWTLDLSASDTPVYLLTTYSLGWAQLDSSGTFSRVNHQIQRTNSALNAGLVNEYTSSSLAQRVSVEFNAAEGIASGGTINWSIGLRVQTGATDFYLVSLTSSPGTPATDGLLSLYSVPALTFLGGGYLTGPSLDLTHRYRLTGQATGSYPTTLTCTCEDLTAGTTVATFTIADSSYKLQGDGQTCIPGQSGTVTYSSLTIDCNGDRGPTFGSALTATPITTTTILFSWPAATGGFGSVYRYRLQYRPLDVRGVVTATDWTTVGAVGGSTATSATVTLGRGTYAVRVQVIDDYAMNQKTTYSSWLTVHVAPAVFEDLTTAWLQRYQPVLRAVAGGGDDTTTIANDRHNAQGFDNEDDLNTAYSDYIDTDF